MSVCKFFGKGCNYLCKPFRERTYCVDSLIVITLLLIFLYIILYYVSVSLGMSRRLFSTIDMSKKFASCSGCDLWVVSHFIFYLILGFLFPHLLFEFLIIGIVWEFFETAMMFYRDSPLLESIKLLNKRDYYTMFGRVSDIAFNTSGLIIGWKLRQYFN